MAQTVAVFGERPTANALGIGVSAIATRGLGRLAWMHSRSIDRRAARGASCGGDLARAHREPARSCRSVKYWTRNSAAGDHGDRHRAGAGGDQHRDQDGVDEPQQEQRQQHPGLKAAVAAK